MLRLETCNGSECVLLSYIEMYVGCSFPSCVVDMGADRDRDRVWLTSTLYQAQKSTYSLEKGERERERLFILLFIYLIALLQFCLHISLL